MSDKPGPGKFECNESETISDYLYHAEPDEQFGTVDENGWFGLIRYAANGYTGYVPIAPHYIVEEDPNGFFVYWPYPTLEAVNSAWEKIVSTFNGS